jgi:hypothetical protein
MPDHDLVLLRSLVFAHGLYEVLIAMSRIASDHASAIASQDAHMANEWMHRSVALDGLAVELEGVEAD